MASTPLRESSKVRPAGSAKIRRVNRTTANSIRYVVKWLVIPMLLAALGFFVVGPRLTKPFEYTPAVAPASDGETSGTEGDAPRSGDPNVEVTATPAGR